MRRIIWFGLVTICTFLATANPLLAGFMYQLADSLGMPTTSFTISAVGGAVDVKVYLQEDVVGTLLSTNGLFSASAKITYDSPSGIAKVMSSSLSDIIPNPAFSLPLSSSFSSTTEAGFMADVGLSGSLLSPDSDNRILLGTLRFTGLSAGTVAIAVMDGFPSPSSDTIAGDPTAVPPIVLDSEITTALGSITVLGGGVEPVPEPSTLTLLALGALGLLGHHTRRWRAGKKA